LDVLVTDDSLEDAKLSALKFISSRLFGMLTKVNKAIDEFDKVLNEKRPASLTPESAEEVFAATLDLIEWARTGDALLTSVGWEGSAEVHGDTRLKVTLEFVYNPHLSINSRVRLFQFLETEV